MRLFKKSEKKFNFRDIVQKCAWIWDKGHKIVLVIFFIALVGLGSYVWYQSIYSGQWSADKKQQYLNSQEKGVSLKEWEFNKTLDDIKQRKQAFDSDYTPIKDIFIPYPGAPVDTQK